MFIYIFIYMGARACIQVCMCVQTIRSYALISTVKNGFLLNINFASHLIKLLIVHNPS